MTWKFPGLVAIALAAGASLPARSQDIATANHIAWGTCPANLASMAGPWARRLQCGVFLAPRDWRATGSTRDRPVGLLRITAGSRAKRQGSLFMNFGGPGLHPATQLVHLGNDWQATNPADTVIGAKRRLMQQYDLVTVVPRGLNDHDAFTCALIDPVAPNDYFLGERSDENWNALVAAAHGNADDCSSLPDARLMDSEQHVRDMELARSLLGESRFNFYGASYGGWVGALYGSLFPEKVGRMVLDSTVDASGSMERFHLLRPQWREHDLTRFGTMPAAAQPAFWGLGSDSKTIRARLQAMPKLLRALWIGHAIEPHDVVAALEVADLYAAQPESLRTRSAMKRKIAGHHFHDRINQTVAASATRLVDLLPESAGSRAPYAYGWPGATLATYCNDGRWRSTPAGVRASLGRNSEFASFDDGDSSLIRLICARWPNSGAARPSMAALRTAPGLLMIHSDLDLITPLKGALTMAAELPTSKLIVVEGLATHGVMTAAPSCAITAAGDFLLTGNLPQAAHSTCVSGALVPKRPDPTRDEL